MNNVKKILLFSLILFVGLTAVSAADIIEDDSNAVAVETPQVEQTNNVQESMQETDNNEYEDTTPTRSSVTINSDVTINDQNTYDMYNGKDWIVQTGVTVTGSPDYALSDVSIKVNGNQATLKNLYITSQDISDYIINVTSVNNFRIDNSHLTITNINNIPTMGIYVKSSDNVIINGTTLTVNAPAQAQQWYNTTPYDWYSVLEVSGVYSDHSNNVKLENSTITITNTTHNIYGSTMPAVTIRNNSNQISIKNNTISSTGAQYVYGIMMNDLVNDVETKDNTITVNGLYYVAGIDASTASNSKTSKNTITATSQGATTYPDGYESLAYGIISDTYSSGNTGNHICQNTIDISANVCYGIEMYNGMNNFICANDITATGTKVMGVDLAHSTNNKIINNIMSLTGTDGIYHNFYEEVTPVNAGIILTNQSNGNRIQGNNIEITANGDSTTRAINLQNSTTTIITGNELSATGTNTYYENYAIIQDALCSEITLGENDEVVPYNCDCGCMNSNTPSQNEVISFYKSKIIKQNPANAENILIIDDDNYLDYGVTKRSGKEYRPNGNLMLPNTNVILNVSFENVTFVNYTANNINFLGSLYECKIQSTIGGVQSVIVPGNISNCYAPNCRIQIDSDNSYIINSTFAMATETRNNVSFINNTIIQMNTTPWRMQLYFDGHNITVKDNYMVFLGALGYTSEIRDDIIVENNGPFYENPEMLNNSNYNTYFDENNNLKSEYENKVLFATEKITNPVTISNKVTLTGLRGTGGYTNINLIEGSDNSIIEDSIINKITINGANNININNNKLVSDDSIIEVINSVENIIENNTINTKNTNTITFDEESFGTTVKHNELIANELTGDSSVLTTEDNTVEENTPISEEPILTPELKVDTTEFTIGDKTSITASIYLGDEVASDITGGKIVFKVNGKTLQDASGKVIYAKLINGVATIEDYEIPNSWNKEGLTITAVYSGSSKCEALRSQETNITTTAPTPEIITENTTATIGSTIELKAKITAGDNPITTGKVVFKVNGKTVKDTNGKVIYATVDSNGEVSVNYTIPENMKTNNYTITITYTSQNYGKLNTTSTLTITA